GVQFSITKWFDAAHFYKKIEVEDAALKTPLVYEEKVARFTLQDFTQMLAVHQLKIKEVFGDYQFSTYDASTSPRLIMIASKK
ncbi:MAG: class I SAM-dependent methyltransferase, partial [Ferruginibacter sp.]